MMVIIDNENGADDEDGLSLAFSYTIQKCR